MLKEYHIRPVEFMAMDVWEKTLIMAAVDLEVKTRKKAEKERKKKGGKKR